MLAARLQGAAVSLGQNTTRQELVAGLRFGPHSKLTCVLVRGNHRVSHDLQGDGADELLRHGCADRHAGVVLSLSKDA